MLNPTANDSATSERAGGVSRRLVVKGAAWSVPAIAVASAVPAHAASTDAPNLAATVSNCALVTLNIASDNVPGFTYTATQGTVPAGTQFTVSSGGIVSLNSGNFVMPTNVNVLLLTSGTTATLELQTDLTEGDSFTIGLTGLSVNAVGQYTTTIQGDDAVPTDDIAILTAGGVGVGTLLDAFVCFTPGTAPDGTTVSDLGTTNVAVDVTNCSPVGLLTRPGFQITTDGTIPGGTTFLLYSSSTLSVGVGNWSYDGGTALALDLLGTGDQVAWFNAPREITAANPLTVVYDGVLIAAGATYYLAFLGQDATSNDNTAGMTVSVGLGPLLTVCSEI